MPTLSSVYNFPVENFLKKTLQTRSYMVRARTMIKREWKAKPYKRGKKTKEPDKGLFMSWSVHIMDERNQTSTMVE